MVMKDALECEIRVAVAAGANASLRCDVGDPRARERLTCHVISEGVPSGRDTRE